MLFGTRLGSLSCRTDSGDEETLYIFIKITIFDTVN